MKKIIIRKDNKLYIKKGVRAYYCDFCGEENVEVFESEYKDDMSATGKKEMQICYNCVKQLSFLLTNH